MRSLCYTTLANSDELMASGQGVVNDVYQANSLGTDPVPGNPTPPFVIIEESAPSRPYQVVRKQVNAAAQNFSIRLYTERGDYSLIEQNLVVIRDLLLATEFTLSPSGRRCLDVRWVGNGPDAEDSDLDLIFKSCEMRFVSNITNKGE